MPQPYMQSFDDIVARDRWLLPLTPTPQLASTEAEERLLQLLQSDDDATYAQEMVDWCEATDRWQEATAYAYAHVRAVSRSVGLQSTEYRESAERYAIAMARSAGPLPAAELPTPADFFDVTLLQGSPPVRSAAVISLVSLSAIDGAYFDSLHLTNRARAAVQQYLTSIVARSVRNMSELKGSHELVAAAANALKDADFKLRRTVDDFARAVSMNAMLDRRERLLRSLAFVEPFCLPDDARLVNSVKDALTTGLSRYATEINEPSEQAFADALAAVSHAMDDCRMTSSHFAACVLIPLLVAVDVALRSHYQGTLHSQYAALSVALVKPEASIHGENAEFQLRLTNSGSARARNLRVTLTGRDGAVPKLSNAHQSLGDLGQGREVTIRCSAASVKAEFTLEATVEWDDRAGRRSEVHAVKVSRQRQLDWTAAIGAGSPYRIQSISDPDRLKGRSQDLQRLRLGVQSGSSFIVTGQKRAGKTSLIRVFLQGLEINPRQLPVYVTVGELSVAAGVGDLGLLGRELMEIIAEIYHDRTGQRLDLPEVDVFDRSGFNAPFTRFARRLRKELNTQLVLAIDDLDELPLQFVSGATGKALFLAFRSVLDSGHSLMFVGSERLPATMKEQSLRLNQPQQLKVDYLERDALAALVRDPTSEILRFTPQAIEFIGQWSAGNPYFATMISNASWNSAMQTEDYWIVDSDVRAALDDVVRTSERNSYEHFWADSPLAREEERRAYEHRSAALLLALAESQPDPLAFIGRKRALAAANTVEVDEAGVHLDELVSRGVVETHPTNPDLVRIRVPMFTRWLRERGSSQLRLQFEDTRPPVRQDAPELPAHEVMDACAGLQYKGEAISTDAVRVWLGQFGSIERQRLILPLLRRLRDRGLYSLGRFNNALHELHERVKKRANELGFPVRSQGRGRGIVSNVFVTHADRVGQSGAGLVRAYRLENRVRETNCGSPQAVVDRLRSSSQERSVLIVIDDFIGTGQSAVRGLRTNVLPLMDEQLPGWESGIVILYVAVTGFAAGVEQIDESLQGKGFGLCFDQLDEGDRAFSPKNDIFERDSDRVAAQEMVLEIGMSLEPDQPLGWEGSEALVVFPDRVPNNSLPILYKHGAKHGGRVWSALFPR